MAEKTLYGLYSLQSLLFIEVKAHKIKSTVLVILSCTIQWLLVYSQCYTIIITVSLQKETSCLSSSSFPFPSSSGH
jgi:hypothetical protein